MHPSESYKKPVGRPATGKTKRVVNLNLSHETDDRLTEYCAKKDGAKRKSKSKVVEAAIMQYLNNNDASSLSKNKKSKHNIDYFESQIADILSENHIRYTFEKAKINGRCLDFYLEDYDVFIEWKQYFSHRSSAQLESQEDVILIQGKKSLAFINHLFKKSD